MAFVSVLAAAALVLCVCWLLLLSCFVSVLAAAALVRTLLRGGAGARAGECTRGGAGVYQAHARSDDPQTLSPYALKPPEPLRP